MTATTKTKATKYAERRTADGYAVGLWSDGCVTSGYLHQCVKGAGVARSEAVLAGNLAAGWLVLGEVELYTRAELPALVRVARKMARHGLGPVDMNAFRAAVAAELEKTACN